MIQDKLKGVKGIKYSKGLIIEPLPCIQRNYKDVTNVEEINILMNKFHASTIIEAMNNKKIKLIVK